MSGYQLFMSKEEFLTHRSSHCTRRIACQTCGATFPRVQSLVSHLVNKLKYNFIGDCHKLHVQVHNTVECRNLNVRKRERAEIETFAGSDFGMFRFQTFSDQKLNILIIVWISDVVRIPNRLDLGQKSII